MENVLIGLITALTGTAAWQFYTIRVKLNQKNDEYDREEKSMYREDLRARVRALELLLHDAAEEKDALRAQILELVAKVNRMEITITWLQNENQRLQGK
jgi:hypothetical protein